MIGIVDYGLGNILAFLNVYKRLNIAAGITRTPEELRGVSKIVLPGVGAFDHAMELLVQSGMRDALEERVIAAEVPVLGVCVGMQILAHSSDEGRAAGLGWIDGHVKALKSLQSEELPQPHMGWNDVMPAAPNGLFRDLASGARFYFLHSYCFECNRAQDVAAVCTYGAQFTCAVHARNIYGVQFHPEKSHHFGARLLENFARL